MLLRAIGVAVKRRMYTKACHYVNLIIQSSLSMNIWPRARSLVLLLYSLQTFTVVDKLWVDYLLRLERHVEQRGAQEDGANCCVRVARVTRMRVPMHNYLLSLRNSVRSASYFPFLWRCRAGLFIDVDNVGRVGNGSGPLVGASDARAGRRRSLPGWVYL